MARAGEVLENAATGDRLTFRANHNWAIKRATEGLEPYAKRQAGAG